MGKTLRLPFSEETPRKAPSSTDPVGDDDDGGETTLF
ncbi:uncharacterized protein G2W53_006909 [Senna tora]|uniref:Uncharacterized protein n=1 Tax=Senna tora TaxID=362788 RepID=A0A835CGX6_9FABA|nr:uncharacterized protein G2W53_006909 [Senna tora]